MKRARNTRALLVLGSSFVTCLSPRQACADVVTEFAPVEESAPTPPRAFSSSPAGTSARPAQTPGVSLAVAPNPPAAEPPTVEPSAAPPASSLGTTTRIPESPDASEEEVEAPPRPFLTSTSPDVVRDEAPTENGSEGHVFSLTFSAARAFASLYEITTEVALGRHIGVAALLGLGSLDAKHPSYSQTIHLDGRELGAQARVYVLGDFDHGLMLGGEVLRVWAEAKPTQVTDPSVITVNGTRYSGTAMLEGQGTLTGVGAFVGYKVVTGFGLTFDAKLGWQRLTLAGSGTVTGETVIAGQAVQQSESGRIRESQDVPLFNLNLGWSI